MRVLRGGEAAARMKQSRRKGKTKHWSAWGDPTEKEWLDSMKRPKSTINTIETH